ncbi:uncharacterized protein MYCFIDRAFT_172953 [Pseudocercospora fijiensis CIRAD86]|uniref:Uncharacterized protein n=1 Tax=Pseudocercospora fijiensis (strain CIRAD86) TaxID=383855 RepID=M3AH32_PSEFD|nr:uncharacterized protein MYCFIDRAFT_172953 [Pseudocercospora fijiensis CIRAD86]EME83876.1 hypothetical protein MYCFIDRAFT_172953 [Pseudocercospora fijiensis CIRAD86]
MCAAIRAAGQAEGITLLNSGQFYLDSDQGDEYPIQVSAAPIMRVSSQFLPPIYIVDGNALFWTVTEVAWRRSAASHFTRGGVVVAVGYRLKQGRLYDAQGRSLDLTPPSATPIECYGGADLFLDSMKERRWSGRRGECKAWILQARDICCENDPAVRKSAKADWVEDLRPRHGWFSSCSPNVRLTSDGTIRPGTATKLVVIGTHAGRCWAIPQAMRKVSIAASQTWRAVRR